MKLFGINSLKQLIKSIQGDMSQLTGSIVPTFQEVYENLQSLDEDKVDKVEGKGLSTEDYTTAEKNNLASHLGNASIHFTMDEVNKLVVNRVEVSPSANAYDVGDYLIYGGILYKVSEEIAVGDTLRIGTNIKATNVCNELNSLKALIEELTRYQITLNPSTNRLSLNHNGDE